MLKIQRSANGDVVFTVIGRLGADHVSELSALLAAEPAGRSLVLDLKDVVLVDRDVVRFLRAREGAGIALRNCPPYIREWIAREEDSYDASGATQGAMNRIDDEVGK
jgi:anti-anti-sigma regulatory factor